MHESTGNIDHRVKRTLPKGIGPGLLALLLTATWLCPAASAHEEAPTYDRINLDSSASTEVENDILVAVLYYQREGPSAAQLAEDVNATLGKAVHRAKQQAGVRVQTLDYRTHPVFVKQRLTGWRVRQSMRLESRDAAAMGALLGELQERLAVESLTQQVSDARRREAENGLIREALENFRARARLVSEQLGADDYRLVELNVRAGAAPGPMPRMMRAMDAGVAAAPVIEAGVRKISVSVGGTIELQRR